MEKILAISLILLSFSIILINIDVMRLKKQKELIIVLLKNILTEIDEIKVEDMKSEEIKVDKEL
jgi:hypothetical protein